MARAFLAVFLIGALGQTGRASETITYTYDALGRLIATSHAGGENNGLQTGVAYDAAGNRTNYAVTDAPAAPTLSISNASTTEGGTLVFTVTKTGAGAASANWATSDGSALAGSDYVSGSGSVSFAPGESSKTISVVTNDDTLVEPAETMTVTLSGPSAGASIGNATGTGTINDNDVAPSFAISNASAVTEGGTLVFTVTRSGAASGTYSVNFATANGTATSGSDYTATSGTLTFLTGETTKTISVVTIDDTIIESAETVLVNLSAPSGGATISASQASGTINDNDVSFSIANAAAVTEGGTLVFTVTRLGVTTGSYSVSYATANGTATSGSDYTATSGTLTFGSGETTKTINVVTINDFVLEDSETVLVNLSAPTGGATITVAQASGTMHDDDYPPPSFAISNASAVTEGGTLVFTVTKTGTTNTSYSVNFATANGTAISGSDYNAASGTLTFAAHETSKTISVTTIDDFTYESAETVLVNLSAPTGGATITIGQGSGTINDDDYPPPSFSIITGISEAYEGGVITFSVWKGSTTNTTYSVNYATSDGTATAGSDYTATSGTLTFAPHEMFKTISVQTLVDGVSESPETFYVNLSSPTGGATIGSGQGTGRILEANNTPPIANPNSLTTPKCVYRSINVVANDTDPDGDYPLTLVSTNQLWAWVENSTNIGLSTPDTNGTYYVTYTIRDARGAYGTGTLTVTVAGPQQCL